MLRTGVEYRRNRDPQAGGQEALVFGLHERGLVLIFNLTRNTDRSTWKIDAKPMAGLPEGEVREAGAQRLLSKYEFDGPHDSLKAAKRELERAVRAARKEADQ